MPLAFCLTSTSNLKARAAYLALFLYNQVLILGIVIIFEENL
ncbi:hypothetical protein MICAC_4760004 [Microcystis aeruginosa PCC 9443]|uniref:Transposase n=1 Tax=Microcystis aeruginosa PCC 9443 TaxID=1160281 RepID=I4G6R0_MICAE|nr:hypothetical protein MICAC_4760004 [Microcystis aeruginosa PCC 9443]